MPINFPSSPTNGQTFTAGGKVYVYNSTTSAWEKTLSAFVDINAAGDLLVGSGDNAVSRLAVGATDTVLVGDSAAALKMKWSSTLAGLTLTSPRLDYAITRGIEEDVNIVAAAATGTVNFDVLTASVWYYTTNASANFTLNLRGDTSNTLNAILLVGDSLTVVFMNTNGATPYYPTAYQIDGSAVTPRWQGGTAPTAGNASSIDAYTLTIIKTAATPTYVVLGSQTRFA